MTRTLDCYYPGKTFPSVSTTGGKCELSCRHCSGRYLEGMVHMTDPKDLVSFALALADSGGEGFLLSGGSDRQGRVRLTEFTSAIREVKGSTALKINAHVGLSPRPDLKGLVDSGVDAFSVDVYGDDETIDEVLGLGAGAEDYFSVIRDLMDLGARMVAPHLCIGIRGGELSGEAAAIQRLKDLSPDTLVMISFIPTRGTPYEGRPAPSGEDVVAMVRLARESLPRTRLLLGCMRSKRDRTWEIEAVRAGLDGIVLPSESTVQAAESLGYQVRRKTMCCALG